MDSQAEYLMITYLGGFPHLHESRGPFLESPDN